MKGFENYLFDLYIDKCCEILKFENDKVRRGAKDILKFLDRKGFRDKITANDVRAVGGVVIYISALLFTDRRTQKEITAACEISMASFEKQYKLVKEALDLEIRI